MKWPKAFVTVLLAAWVIAGLAVVPSHAQDLAQQKQQKMIRLNQIDNQLKASPTQEEYDRLMQERERLVAEIKDIDARLKADVEAMKRINAVKKAYNDGNTAYRLGQYAQAVEHYDKALSMDPTFYMAYYGKGLALTKLRQYQKAVEAYQLAVQHNPSYSAAYVNMGKIYRDRLRNPDKAMTIFKTAIEKDPSAYKAYYELGVVYLNIEKDYNKAVENFIAATRLKKDYGLGFYSLGVALTELNRLDDALAALDSAIANPERRNWSDPYARKAVVYNKQGNCKAALAAAEKAISLNRRDSLAKYEAGRASKCLGQLQQALSYFRDLKKDRAWSRTAEYEIDLIANRDKYGGNE